MKRVVSVYLAIVLALSLLLCACSDAVLDSTAATSQTTTVPASLATHDTTNTPDISITTEETFIPTQTDVPGISPFGMEKYSPEELLSFPDLSWNIEWTDVVDNLGLEDGAFTYTEISGLGQMIVPNSNAFGVSGAEIRLSFYELNPDVKKTAGLSNVWIIFPDDADMASVKSQIEELYGDAAVPQESMFGCHADEHNRFWASSICYADYLGEDMVSRYVEYMLEHGNADSKEYYQQSVWEKAVTTIQWTDNYGNTAPNTEWKNMVTISSDCGKLQNLEE